MDANYNADYYTTDDKLVLNVKNIDLFINPGQGILYDIWYMSREYDFPIPDTGLSTHQSGYGFGVNQFTGIEYPSRGGVDWTTINPKIGRAHV